MELELDPGQYVVAVSGGVDSMVLLDLLVALSKHFPPDIYRFTVAHFDHGIRPDSALDRLFVQRQASSYGLPFVFDAGNLGTHASEALARQARYAFLQKVRQASGSRAIITAHHHDDVIETAIINLIRGTGRKGLSSLQSGGDMVRPLLAWSKLDILGYAESHKLTWREDSTNSDTKFLRNYIRLQLLPNLPDDSRAKLARHIDKAAHLNDEIDNLILACLGAQADAPVIGRRWFNQFRHLEAKEIMAAWLRIQGPRDFDRQTIERVTTSAKTARPGTKIEVKGPWYLQVSHAELALKQAER